MRIQFNKEWINLTSMTALGVVLGAGVGVVVHRRDKAQMESHLATIYEAVMRHEETIDTQGIQIGNLQQVLTEINRPKSAHAQPMAMDIDVRDQKDSKRIISSLGMVVSDAPREVPPNPDIRDEPDEPAWDYEEELKNRGPDAPYVIHEDEFFSDEVDYTRTTLEWYEGDKILVDENNVPIYDVSNTVGRLEWGRGTSNKNAVYIQNDKFKAKYEVVRNPGYYQVEVLGAQIEDQMAQDDLRHSREPRRFRLQE